MRPVVIAALLAACATPPADEPKPAAVARVPSRDDRVILPEPEEGRPLRAFRLAGRLRETGLGEAKWPRRWDLPKPEACYDAAWLWGQGACCDDCVSEVLVDLENPRVFWIRCTGTIAGVRWYLGPAEILDDAGPLTFRVGE